MDESGTGKKLLWFAGLWIGGVLATGVVGLIIKLWLCA